MRSTLILLFFIVVLVVDSTKALYDKDSYDEKDGNHSFIQPRQAPFPVTSVTIQTPIFPSKYPRNTQVKWRFQFPAPTEVWLICPVFKLRPRKNGICLDYLEVAYGCGPLNICITWYCGDQLDGEEMPISTTLIDLTFKSSKKRKPRYKGFNCTISYLINPDCNCGVYTPPVARDDKIVGGQDTRDNQFPWQAVMVYYNTSTLRCGGSLINDQWILTAAHCTYGLVPSDIQILLGAYCWSNPSPGLLRLDVQKIIQHPGYNDSTFDNDISLLKLEDCIDFINTQFRPVCLPITNTDPIPDEDDVEAVISGFGALQSGGGFPDCLQYAIVPTMTNTLCQSLYPNESITDNMICAGLPGVGEIDSCQGDSGGPMVTNATSVTFPLHPVNYYVQIGVVSWGYGCAEPDFPGVYARVSAYIDWINTKTAGSSTCPPP